jgi:hypothetical protein
VNRPLILTAAGVIVAMSAIGMNYLLPEREKDIVSSPDQRANVKQALETEGPALPADTPPSFDVVRVTGEGDTLIAGRARPGDTVVILNKGREIGRISADNNGEWVFIPEVPLPPGNHRLTLESQTPDRTALASTDEVVLLVPAPDQDIAGGKSDGTSQALALKFARDGTGGSTVLQKPSSGTTSLKLSVDTVDYDQAGNLIISGQAFPLSILHVYLDDTFVGRTKSAEDGAWRITPEQPVSAGQHKLRIDHVDDTGRVLARIAMPVAREEFADDLKPGTFIVVQPGNSLWRLARKTYGTGLNYTIIYQANKDQIGDPDLIFPGQIFTLPPTNG